MSKLSPTIYTDKAFNINFEQLKNNKIKLLCFDLDNTLDKPDSMTKKKDENLIEFFSKIKSEFEILIVSNNTIKGRVDSFASLYDLPYIEAMKKPFKKKYNHPIINKYDKNEVIFIGDKIVTDILGASKLGYKTILVDPLFPKHKTWYSEIMHYSDKLLFNIGNVKRGKYYNKLENNE